MTFHDIRLVHGVPMTGRKTIFGVLVAGLALAGCAAPGDYEDYSVRSGSSGDGGDDQTSNGATSSSGRSGAAVGSGGAGGGQTGAGGSSAIDNGIAYVGTSTNDALSVVDLMLNTTMYSGINLLPGGNYPYDATMKPGGTEVWISGAVGDAATVFNTLTNTVTHTIALAGVGEYPVDVLFDASGSTAYVSSRDHETVVVINAASKTVTGTIPLPGIIDGGKMTLDPCTGNIYMASWYDDYLITIDPMQMTASQTDIGTSLWDLVIEPSGERLYVTDRGTDQVHVVDVGSKTVITSVPVGDDPWGIDITPDGGIVVVASEDSATVHIIDTRINLAQPVARTVNLPADADPRDVDISADGKLAYVPSGDLQAGNDMLYVIDLGTEQIVNTIDLGAASNPNVVAATPQPTTCLP